ncbi:MAG: DUF2244 domain-containing protein [Albidovulum sp.]|uniref:DUF2244 domain-containing protein n=1 Tax=Albidovulum sp. TaxID=1872424 RepID=UPI001320D4EF|nr:DUF2244 domain-containing protein [Defluviimonas sp.]KAB2881915.1 MAG: DUF2244 domain-containing protein [Defluviimonas sp.]
MPYEWLPPDGTERRLRLWPYRSLSARGFVWFVGGTALLISVPLFAVLGTRVLWGLLPFLATAVAGIWWALARSWRDGELTEELTLAPGRMTLVRRAPDGAEQRWEANPYWVAVRLYPTGGPVLSYLTLKGDGREVELGAFLGEAERVALAGEIREALAALR